MAAANTSPLGFLPIILFHLCLLAAAVVFENIAAGWPVLFAGVAGAALVGAAIAGYLYRSFLWDVFRGFKSAGVLLTLLVLSCQLGTMIIQDLDLRRDGVYESGVTDDGSLPPFDSRNQATRFALAESHAWLWLFPSEARTRQYEEKVKLSPHESAQIGLRKEVFGERSARALQEAVLAGKRRHVDERTTSQFAHDHREWFYSFFLLCRQLHLFNIFEAWWFFLLLGLIAVNVTVGTIARAPWDVRNFGVVVTHMGILTILTGSLVDVIVAKEGYIWFTYGRPELEIASRIDDKKNQVHWDLPFRVQLDRFATEYYHEAQVTRFDYGRRHDGSSWQEGQARGTPFSVTESFPVREGVPRLFEDGKVHMVVHQYKPRVFVETVVEESSADGPPDPALRVGIYHDPTQGENLLLSANLRSWLFASDRSRSAIDIPVTGGEVRVEYIRAANATEFAGLIEGSAVPDNGTLVARLDGEQQRLRVDLGGRTRVVLGGRTIPIEFLAIQSALAQSENVNLDRSLQRSEEPELYLRVDGRELRIPRDDSEFGKDFGFLEGLELRFDWPDPRDRGVFDIYRIVDLPGRPPMLVQRASGEGGAAATLDMGQAVPLAGRLRGFYFGVEERVERGIEKPGVREVSDEQFLREGGGDRDHLLAAWADIELTGAFGSVRAEITPFHQSIAYGRDLSGRPLYRIGLIQTQMARDWFSVLSIIDHEGNKVKSHAVQVNKPLRHAGFRFFQANAGTGEDGLGISGISVTKNPGVRYMYVGYTVLTIGVCWIFFFRPWYDRRRRSARRAAQEKTS